MWLITSPGVTVVPNHCSVFLTRMICQDCTPILSLMGPHPHLATRSRSTPAPTSRSLSVILTPGKYCRVSTRVDEYCLYIGRRQK